MSDISGQAQNDPHGYLISKAAIQSVGGYVEGMGSCEDWAVYAKVAMNYGIYVSATPNYLYRQHSEQTCSRLRENGELNASFGAYYEWLKRYLQGLNCDNRAIWLAYRRAVRANKISRWRESLAMRLRRALLGVRGRGSKRQGA